MSLERDMQCKIAVIDMDGVTVNEAASFASATIIDTKPNTNTPGFRAVQFAVEPSRVLDEDPAVEAFRFMVEDSPDLITWTVVPEEKILPTRNFNAAGQLIFNAVAPYLQTFGVTSAQRYLRVSINCTVYNQVEAGFAFVAALEAENHEFVDYDPNAPLTDGNP